MIYVSSTAAPAQQRQQQAPAPLQAPRPSAAPGVTPSYRVIGKKPIAAYVCPNRHTAAHAAAALVILRELRGVLGRVGAADAGVAAALALAIRPRVLHDATDAVDAAVDRNARVVAAASAGAGAADAASCVCASCWPSYALPRA